MTTIYSRFALGENVVHFTGTHGMITAIFHRAGRNSYEMSFCDNDGIPACRSVEECELDISKNGSLGFEKKK